ncbi:Uncharacterised protein [Mycobacterium tuberculosis]|nr:Uncharacterised protein [Mycobacterium tuberculosis]
MPPNMYSWAYFIICLLDGAAAVASKRRAASRSAMRFSGSP